MTDEAESPSPKKVGKKKHYPFGTPSHLNHPYSEFAHLPISTRDFAQALATATGIKAEVIEDEPKKVRRALPTPVKKKGKKKKKKAAEGEASAEEEEDDDDEDDEDSITNGSEGLQPCTKIGCQMVIRAISDIQLKNQVEKMDIEDEFDRLKGEVMVSEQDIVSSEGKLDKLTDIGNQLEIKLNQIMTKVESFEKTKESLQNERTDINTKLMLLELERQKANRRLEKAQKSLTDARWKKKKQAQQQDADAGIALQPSAISESSIIHVPSSVASKAAELYETDYNYLAKPQVVDYIERAPTVKTLPVYVQDKMYDSENVNRLDAKLDKYAKRHYKKLVEGSLKSWKDQEGTVVASSMETCTLGSQSSVGLHQSLGQYSAMTSMISTAASSRVGSTLLARTSSSAKHGNHMDKANKTMDMLESLHTLMEYTSNGQHLNGVKSITRSGSREVKRKQLRSSSSVKLQPLASPHQLGSGLDAMSSVSNGDDVHGVPQQDFSEFHDKLAQDGIFLNQSFPFAPGGSLLEAGSVAPIQKKKLDGVFLNSTSRSHWGRNHVLGAIRTRDDDDTELSSPTGKGNKNRNNTDGDDKGNKNATIRKGGMVLLDARVLPKVTSRTLTTKHPGMHAFEDSVSVH